MTFRVTIILSAFLMCGMSARSFAIETGEVAPPLELNRLESSEIVRLSDLRGKIVYLDFWATWCPSCRISLPWLNDLQSRFSKSNFEIIAISVDKNPQKVSEYISKEQLNNLTILQDPTASSARTYKLQSFPFSVLLNKEGQIIQTFKGFQASHKEQLTAALEKLL